MAGTNLYWTLENEMLGAKVGFITYRKMRCLLSMNCLAGCSNATRGRGRRAKKCEPAKVDPIGAGCMNMSDPQIHFLDEHPSQMESRYSAFVCLQVPQYVQL